MAVQASGIATGAFNWGLSGGRSSQALRRGHGRACDFGMADGDKIGNSGKAGQRAARKARLSAALRENLKRRKQQARQRAGEASSQQGNDPTHAPDFRRNRGGE
jgi:hypothetical protein